MHIELETCNRYRTDTTYWIDDVHESTKKSRKSFEQYTKDRTGLNYLSLHNTSCAFMDQRGNTFDFHTMNKLQSL